MLNDPARSGERRSARKRTDVLSRTLPNRSTRGAVLASMLLIARTCVLALAFVVSAAAQPADPFAYDARAPLALSTTLTRTEGAVEVYAIAFDSPKGGRVTGKMFVPRGTAGARYAGLLMAHGAPGSTANLDPRALYFARKGAVVIGIDAAFARRDPKSPVDFTARDVAEQVQTIVDMRRAIDVLVSRDDVDPARLGFIGNSYGAAMGGQGEDHMTSPVYEIDNYGSSQAWIRIDNGVATWLNYGCDTGFQAGG